MFKGSDRFQLLGTLGEGGMGVVYEAVDRDREMRVALKALRGVDPISQIRFKREFRAASELSHPNIVNLYELVADGDHLFFTMELVPGHSLIEFVRAGRTAAPRRSIPLAVDAVPSPSHKADADADTTLELPPFSDTQTQADDHRERPTVDSRVDLQRLRIALRQLADALHALHGAGLVHRDLKPSNVRVTPAQRVVLLDFGIVADNRRASRGTQAAVGTPPYMAPEQALGDPATASADWYAFGSILYLALTGRLPFRGSRREILSAKQEREPPAPSELVSGVPEDLDTLCMQLLRRRAHRRPAGQNVLRALGAQRAVDSATAELSVHSVFVGRAAELDSLHEGYLAAAKKRTVSFVVEGESGMGKSTLVRHFLDELEASTGAGHRPYILSARCHERESMSYKGVDGLIDDLAVVLASLPERQMAQLLPADVAVLARQFPVLRRVRGVRPDRAASAVNPHDLRVRALAALSFLFKKLSELRPVLMYIDDLQWAGRDSLELLSNLLRDAPPQRLMFVASVRSENIASDATLREVIDDLAAQSECRQLALGPLSNAEQRELVQCMRSDELADAPADDVFWSQFAATPLFLVELLRYLEEARPSPEALAELGLDEVLSRRVARLEPGPRSILAAMAIAGEALPLSILSQAAGLTPHDGERAAAALRVGHLARVSASDREPWLVCNHDRLRNVVARNLRLPQRRELHRQLAETLEGWRDAAPENLARHWLAADEIGEATAYLRQGAKLASEKFAFDHAAELLQAAMDLDAAHLRPRADRAQDARSPTDDADDARADLIRAERLADLANAQYLAGRSYDAARTYEAAAALANGDDALDFERQAADNLLRSGHFAEGIDKLSKVLESVGARVPRTRRGATMSFLWRRARLAIRGLGYTKRSEAESSARDLGRLDTMYAASAALGMVDHLRGAALQTRHLRAALQLGEERRVIRALAVELAYLLARGGSRFERGQELGPQLLQRARALGDPFLIGLVLLPIGASRFFAGRPQAAIAALSECEVSLTNIPAGTNWERVTCRYFLSLAQASAGNYDGTAATTARSLDSAIRTSDLYARTFFMCIPRTWVLLRDDKPEEADRSLDAALDGWPTTPYYVGHYIQSFSRILIHLYRGEGEAASAALDRTRPQLRQLMLDRMPWIMSERCVLETRAALQTGDLRGATRWARRLARTGIDYNTGVAKITFAAIAHRQGDDSQAGALLMEARASFAEVGAAQLVAACDHRLRGLGTELPPETRAWIATQAVVNPERLFGLLLPF